MFAKTFGPGLRFALVLALTSSSLWGQGSQKEEAPREAQVTISVYNDAGVPQIVLAGGEEEASRVFQRAGILVKWLNCGSPAASEEASKACVEFAFPEHLHLRIVPRSLTLRAEMMGISFLGANGVGCFADLFYEPMEGLHKSEGTDLVVLLGHVAAHEIGHLLLGTNSHSVAGIMHPRWSAQELTSAKVGGLVFLDKESQRMKARLVTRLQASREVALTVTKTGSARAGD